MSRPNSFERSFCIDQIQKLDEGVVSFHNLRIDKPEHRGKLYYAKYSDSSNEPTHTYYGAKISDNRSTFGGSLPLMNEFISSTILHSISHLRSDPLFCAPAVLIHVEDSASTNFRLLSRMLPNFEPLKTPGVPCEKNSAYLAGVITAMQEMDPNFSNYGTSRNEISGKQIAAKIDTNSFYDPSARKREHGGIYFNHLQRPGIREEAIVTDRNYGNYGALVAANGIFDTMATHKSPDLIKFVGEEDEYGPLNRLRIKQGGEKNFKYFMLGVQDFISMPQDFIDQIYRKTLNDLRKKSVSLARQEEKNIREACERITDLQQAIDQYFSNELVHFHNLLAKDGKEYRSPWDDVIRSIQGEEKSPSSSEDISFDDSDDDLPTPPSSNPIKKGNLTAVVPPPVLTIGDEY